MRPPLSRLALPLACALAAPVAAPAQGLYFNGLVAVDHLNFAGIGRTLGYADVNVGVNPQGAGGFGFEAGFTGLFTSPLLPDRIIPFAAVTYGLGGGRLHVGAPRPGSYGFMTDPVVTGAPSLIGIVGSETGHTPLSTVISGNADRPMVGVRYDRQSGGLSYAASIGRIDTFGGMDVFSLGIAHEGPRGRVFGTLEHYSIAGPDATVAVIGASTQLTDMVTVGGNVRRVSGGGATTVVSAFATARLTDRISVTASAFDSTSAGRYVGVNAGFDVWNGVVLNAGYVRRNGVSTIWSAGLSRRF